MSAPAARTGLGFAFVAIAVVLALAIAWWLQAGTLAPSPAVGGAAPAAAGGEPAPDVEPALASTGGGPDPAVAAPVSRTEQSTTRVAGVARSGSGELLHSWHVLLHSPEPLPAPGKIDLTRGKVRATRHATTAADGTFAFDDLEPGNYEIQLANGFVAPISFALARNEEKWIELRGAGVRVEVHVARFGAPIARARVTVGTGERSLDLYADDAGITSCVLAPGTYQVRVHNELWPVGPTGVQTMAVPTGVAATTWWLEACGIDLQVDAHYADGQPCKQFEVAIDGTLATGERAARAFQGSSGTARFARVPPGRWRVTVRALDFVEPPPREITTDNSMPSEHLEFVVAPGAIVRLVLRGPNPERLTADPSLLPWLVTPDTALRCRVLQPAVRRTPAQVGYGGVPPGRARLVVEDRVGDSGVEFLPFEPHAPIDVDVELGHVNDVVVDVLRRAYVDLRGCDASGREDPAAHVSVFAGARPVIGVGAAGAQRWSGWLPTGDYRVQVDRKGAMREHTLQVGRTDVAMRLRP